jgi:predicted amidohydrolase YtcJ
LAIGATLAVLCLLNMTACSGLDSGTEADLVLQNGTVITVDSQDNVAEAVAVQDGKIVAVGTDREIERWVGPGTTRIDLEGSTVTPGLLDAHAHFAYGGTRRLYLLDLSYPNVKSVADVVALVAAQVDELEPGEWVHGAGWDEGKLAELRYIYASDLDSVAPDNPVWLSHTMGHYGAANSRALRLAGIDENTPAPPGGTIDRYPDGTPTGVRARARIQRGVHDGRKGPGHRGAYVGSLSGRFGRRRPDRQGVRPLVLRALDPRPRRLVH